MADALSNFVTAFQPAFNAQMGAAKDAAGLRVQELDLAERRRAALERERLADLLAQSTIGVQRVTTEAGQASLDSTRRLAPSYEAVILGNADLRMRELNMTRAVRAAAFPGANIDEISGQFGVSSVEVRNAAIVASDLAASRGNIDDANALSAVAGNGSRFERRNDNQIYKVNRSSTGNPTFSVIAPTAGGSQVLPKDEYGVGGVLRPLNAAGNGFAVLGPDGLPTPTAISVTPAAGNTARPGIGEALPPLFRRFSTNAPAAAVSSTGADPGSFPTQPPPAYIPDGVYATAPNQTTAETQRLGSFRAPPVPAATPLAGLQEVTAKLAAMREDLTKAQRPGLLPPDQAARVIAHFNSLTGLRDKLMAEYRSAPPVNSIGGLLATREAAMRAQAEDEYRRERTLSQEY